MIRNLQTHFALNPKLDKDTIRSKFTRTNRHLTTANAGQIIPIYVDEMYPGDTFNMKVSELIRQATPIHATMDDIYLDTYHFSVPWRLCWKHTKEFFGENTTSAGYEDQPEYNIPQTTSPNEVWYEEAQVDETTTGTYYIKSGNTYTSKTLPTDYQAGTIYYEQCKGWKKGSLADYMGIPPKVPNLSVSSIPFRAYGLIYNEWFRDENLVNPVYINDDDATTEGTNGNVAETDIQGGGMPAIAAKLPDYFTTCLPYQQKGPDVLLPLGTNAPIISESGLKLTTDNSNTAYLYTPETATNSDVSNNLRMYVPGTSGQVPAYTVLDYKEGLVADLSNATAATIIALRKAFAIQSFFEKDARGGTRYIEIIQNHFGVSSSDARLQRPEYLGGKRIMLNMQQVVQTSATDNVTPQGNISGYSLTSDREQEVTFSAEEHCIYMILAVIRYKHSYQQGIERFWTEKDKFDKYWPTFNGIGDQAVRNEEIYATGTDEDKKTFGFQERYGHLRYKPNRISGAFRSTYNQSLDSWHLGDKYESQPYLSPEWIKEDKSNIDRTLAVTSELENQFLLDFYFVNDCVRPLPAYSIPGMRSYL